MHLCVCVKTFCTFSEGVKVSHAVLSFSYASSSGCVQLHGFFHTNTHEHSLSHLRADLRGIYLP